MHDLKGLLVPAIRVRAVSVPYLFSTIYVFIFVFGLSIFVYTSEKI